MSTTQEQVEIRIAAQNAVAKRLSDKYSSRIALPAFKTLEETFAVLRPLLENDPQINPAVKHPLAGFMPRGGCDNDRQVAAVLNKARYLLALCQETAATEKEIRLRLETHDLWNMPADTQTALTEVRALQRKDGNFETAKQAQRILVIYYRDLLTILHQPRLALAEWPMANALNDYLERLRKGQTGEPRKALDAIHDEYLQALRQEYLQTFEASDTLYFSKKNADKLGEYAQEVSTFEDIRQAILHELTQHNEGKAVTDEAVIAAFKPFELRYYRRHNERVLSDLDASAVKLKKEEQQLLVRKAALEKLKADILANPNCTKRQMDLLIASAEEVSTSSAPLAVSLGSEVLAQSRQIQEASSSPRVSENATIAVSASTITVPFKPSDSVAEDPDGLLSQLESGANLVQPPVVAKPKGSDHPEKVKITITGVIKNRIGHNLRKKYGKCEKEIREITSTLLSLTQRQGQNAAEMLRMRRQIKPDQVLGNRAHLLLANREGLGRLEKVYRHSYQQYRTALIDYVEGYAVSVSLEEGVASDLLRRHDYHEFKTKLEEYAGEVADGKAPTTNRLKYDHFVKNAVNSLQRLHEFDNIALTSPKTTTERVNELYSEIQILEDRYKTTLGALAPDKAEAKQFMQQAGHAYQVLHTQFTAVDRSFDRKNREALAAKLLETIETRPAEDGVADELKPMAQLKHLLTGDINRYLESGAHSEARIEKAEAIKKAIEKANTPDALKTEVEKFNLELTKENLKRTHASTRINDQGIEEKRSTTLVDTVLNFFYKFKPEFGLLTTVSALKKTMEEAMQQAQANSPRRSVLFPVPPVNLSPRGRV